MSRLARDIARLQHSARCGEVDRDGFAAGLPRTAHAHRGWRRSAQGSARRRCSSNRPGVLWRLPCLKPGCLPHLPPSRPPSATTYAVSSTCSSRRCPASPRASSSRRGGAARRQASPSYGVRRVTFQTSVPIRHGPRKVRESHNFECSPGHRVAAWELGPSRSGSVECTNAAAHPIAVCADGACLAWTSFRCCAPSRLPQACLVGAPACPGLGPASAAHPR